MLRDIIAYWMIYWPEIAGFVHLTIGLVAASHAILNKSDVRAAIGWVGIIWLTPLIGSLLYFLFGINRIHRVAQSLRVAHFIPPPSCIRTSEAKSLLSQVLPPDQHHLLSLAQLVGTLTKRPLVDGNMIVPLQSGEEAYPEMLQAIDEAQQSITLSSYIFDNDDAGKLFREALQRAMQRGVEVRVLIDAVGSRYTFPSIVGSLRSAKIPVATFMPTRFPWRFHYSNLRSHRKILVIDGRIGFTGGMNIREGYLLSADSKHPIKDIHFRIDGPVVAQHQEVFAQDWAFTTGEALVGDRWFPEIGPAVADDGYLARGVSDGPDEDWDKMRLTLLGAIDCAHSSLMIVTPYFIPDPTIITALNVAAMRGVDVDIIVPERGNLRLVQWASTAQMWQILQYGCRVWLSPPPFDHSKLMVVDHLWSFIGSTNWDDRSLRLNFEFNVECYNSILAEQLVEIFEAKRKDSKPLTLADVESRHLLVKLRDGIVRLASPYL